VSNWIWCDSAWNIRYADIRKRLPSAKRRSTVESHSISPGETNFEDLNDCVGG
jgi:hypothetical protein